MSRHRASFANVLAGYFMAGGAGAAGLLLFAVTLRAVWRAGGELPLSAEVGWSWVAVFWAVIAGAAILLIAGVLWWFTRWASDRHVAVHENGLSIHEADASRDVRWADVELLVEVDVGERPPLLHFPANLLLPRRHSKRYEVWVRGDSEPHRFDKNTVSDLADFADALIAQCRACGVPVRHREDLS